MTKVIIKTHKTIVNIKFYEYYTVSKKLVTQIFLNNPFDFKAVASAS